MPSTELHPALYVRSRSRISETRPPACLLLSLLTSSLLVCTCNAFQTNIAELLSLHGVLSQRQAWERRQYVPPVAGATRDSDTETPPVNLLGQLQQRTTIWADTADVSVVGRFRSHAGIVDVTTNPSIVSAAARQLLKTEDFLSSQEDNQPESLAPRTAERLAVDLGCRLLDVVPGRVCTQLDVRCEDSGRMVDKALDIVDMYAKSNVALERVLIKTPATWAGIRATQTLEEQGVNCLVTLVCSEVQGRAAAEAGASIIATYVGRVSDWHKNLSSTFPTSASENPGVIMTNNLQTDFRINNIRTEVMAASFRGVDQIAALAGCDHMTIAPALINRLIEHGPMDSLTDSVSKSEATRKVLPVRQLLDEEAFLSFLQDDQCGTDVLRSSVDGFAKDTRALEDAIAENLHGFRKTR